MIVATGFIAKNPAGQVTTLRRNGSDYSATIVGRAAARHGHRHLDGCGRRVQRGPAQGAAGPQDLVHCAWCDIMIDACLERCADCC